MRRAPHDTRLGQLQRGRGAGFLAALAHPIDARDEVLRCILSDPRVDAQIETRGAYYAEIAQRIGVDVAPIVRRAAGDDAWLAVDVLAELAARGHPVAAELLAHPEREPVAATSVLATLVQHGDWAAERLQQPAAAFLADQLDAHQELVDSVEIHGEFWERWRTSLRCVERAFVDAAARAAAAVALAPSPVDDPRRLSTADLLDRARDGRCDWQRACAELAQRHGEHDRALLAECVVSLQDGALLATAATTLGSFGDLRLLASAEAMFARTDLDFGGTANAIERQRRLALLQYVTALPPTVTVPLARSWWPRGGYLRTAAGTVLEHNVEARDREWLEDFVARTAGTASHDAIREIVALVRIGDPRSLPALIDVAEQATYAYARTHAQRGIAAHAEDARAQAVLHEALWDCEDEAVELACAHVSARQPAARTRLAEILAAPLVSEATFACALSRALA